MIVKAFFDDSTFTLSYVLHAEGAKEAIVIDPVLDFDQASGKINEASVGRIVQYLSDQKLTPVVCLETHAHADHLSGSQVLKRQYPQLKIAISKRISEVQAIFTEFFNIDAPSDGSQFDELIEDGEEKVIAGLNVRNIPTPGHTPACSSYLIEGAVFTGDAMFMPDYGVGRCDFPGGSAKTLYQSISKNLFTLPDDTPVYVGHDYQPGGREMKYQTTIGQQKESNVQLNARIVGRTVVHGFLRRKNL
jgi:glyoxylase-like metal-dependent hydrolase (beta-lactamase superfamily II)